MELATAALDLAGVYSSLFTHTTTQSDNTIPLCHENTHSKILLHEVSKLHDLCPSLYLPDHSLIEDDFLFTVQRKTLCATATLYLPKNI